LAAYFGTKGEGTRQNLAASLAFFRSPVFFALALGLAWGHLGLPGDKNLFMHPVFEVCRILAQALTPLAILSVGLMFRVPKLRECLAALAVVVAIKLILKPLMLGAAADVLGYPRLWRDVLVVLGAMPSALLGVVFLRRYGGDASLASALLLAATILSCGTLVLVFWAVG
ncbi:MAG: AEC family transporter, partial [Desulfovibrionaceae bacterium]|nr:AEC family transporter [Desulfovibrionaceae bacterium]